MFRRIFFFFLYMLVMKTGTTALFVLVVAFSAILLARSKDRRGWTTSEPFRPLQPFRSDLAPVKNRSPEYSAEHIREGFPSGHHERYRGGGPYLVNPQYTYKDLQVGTYANARNFENPEGTKQTNGYGFGNDIVPNEVPSVYRTVSGSCTDPDNV